jgi:uncharacterized delta-60 repeat protein
MRQIYRSESNFTRRVVSYFYKSSARLLALVILSIHLLLPGGALADQGDLDLNFGIGGKVTTNIGNNDFVGDMVTLPDGRIVVAGYTSATPQGVLALACYTAGGSLDPNFGQGGIVTTLVSEGDRAVAVATQGNKIIVLTASFSNAEKSFFSLVRYDANGNLDPTFGNGGIVTTNIPGTSNETPADVAVHPGDGKIVVVGTTALSGNVIAIRYLADGNLDPSSGIDGITEINYQPNGAEVSAVAIHNGKVFIGGKHNGKFLVTQLASNGFVNPVFGFNGRATISFNNVEDQLSAIAIQADGKIVLAGTTIYPNFQADFAVARIDILGSLDPTFGNQGKVVTDFDGNQDNGRDLTLQTDGKIVVAGRALVSGTNTFGVARYNPNGSLDQTFHNDGKISTPFDISSVAEAVTVKNDGNIVVAGQFFNPANTGFDLALASYSTAEPTFDIIIKNDATNRYLKINSVTGAFQFSDCEKGVFAEGIGSLSAKSCKLNFVGGGQNSSVSALVNPCTKQGNATVIVMMQGVPSSKTYQILDTNITNNPNGCP